MAGISYESACLLTDNEIIKKISESIQTEENNDGIILDVKGAWVLPGLIDAHSHIGIFEEKKGQIGDSSNETTEPNSLYKST